MTLPKTFTLASTNFNNFDTMSFEASSSYSGPNAQQDQQLLQEAQERQQQQQVQHSTNDNCPPMASAPDTPMLTTETLDNRVLLNPHRSAADTMGFNSDTLVENVLPGIYLTKDFISWNREQLREHGLTHVIIIDKHIQELYYPNQQPDIFKLCSNNSVFSKRTEGDNRNATNAASGGLHDDSSSLNAFDYFSPPTATALNFGNDFEVINLNFGEKSYLTTVLPNCYRAVKFINKALQNGGKILVIDCNGGEQKCLTIIVAYLMYKNNITFSNAFACLKEFYKKADLDRFYISQLYEYEPILQVQRAQSRGHSCSRELRAAILKRKKPHDDDELTYPASTIVCSGQQHTSAIELFNNCNPLNRFDTTQMEERQNFKIANRHPGALGVLDNGTTTYTRFMCGTTTGGWYNWDDYAME